MSAMGSDLSAKTCIVTGASEGTGKAIAGALVQAGNRVVYVSRSLEKLQCAVKELGAGSEWTGVYAADMTDPAQVNRCVHTVLEQYERIDVLVNNLGGGLRRTLIETSDSEWQHLIQINLSSAFYACRAVLPVMRRQRSGWIINIASRAGRRGEGDFAAYSAAKFGLMGLTQALADSESPFGIRVNAICSGPIATERMKSQYPQADLSGWNKPQDVAEAVLFLLSPAAHAMQGQSIDLFEE